MNTKIITNLTKEEKDTILKSPGGVERLLALNGSHLLEIKDNIQNWIEKINEQEEKSARWINLTILLAVFQILPAFNTHISQTYIICCIPSLAIAIYSTSLILLKHSSIVKPNFGTTEDQNILLRLKIVEAVIDALTKIIKSLKRNYDFKVTIGKYTGSAIIVNTSVSFLFIIVFAFYSQILNLLFCSTIGVLSVFIIYFLASKLSSTKTYNYNISLKD